MNESNLFDGRLVKPMLLGKAVEPFDSPNYLFELKLDGLRCIAYVDKTHVDLRNKRNLSIGHLYPELADMYQFVKTPCILDGELIVMKEGQPNFQDIQSRSLMNDPFKIRLKASMLPVSFVVWDVIYHDGKSLVNQPLTVRKKILSETVTESMYLSISRYIENHGISLYRLTEEKSLEGIVAKEKSSRYTLGARTKRWLKCKVLHDAEFIICGYIPEKPVGALILASNEGGELTYRGRVAAGISRDDWADIKRQPPHSLPTLSINNKSIVWIEPRLQCTVQYMEVTKQGHLRQPVFKSLVK